MNFGSFGKLKHRPKRRRGNSSGLIVRKLPQNFPFSGTPSLVAQWNARVPSVESKTVFHPEPIRTVRFRHFYPVQLIIILVVLEHNINNQTLTLGCRGYCKRSSWPFCLRLITARIQPRIDGFEAQLFHRLWHRIYRLPVLMFDVFLLLLEGTFLEFSVKKKNRQI